MKSLKLFVAVVNLLKTYPAISAGLVNIGVALGAHFGLKVSASQLVEIVSFTAALSAVVVHASVVPLKKIQSPKLNVVEVPIEAKDN